MPKENKCLDLIRIPEDEQHELLEQLESSGQAQSWAEVRRSRRFRYRVPSGLVLRIAGSKIDFRVQPRNISTGGVGVLHGAFIYPNTVCEIELRTLDGKAVLVSGTVVRCRCVNGKIHEVNIRFVQPVEVERFVVTDPAQPVAASAAAAPTSDTAAPLKSAAELAQKLEQLAASDAAREELVAALQKVAAFLRMQSTAR